jgi:hypothetical protein
MDIGILVGKFFKKTEHHRMSRRECIQNTLKNLLFSSNSFELRCWESSAPKNYQYTYTFEEAVEEIDKSPWDGENVFSTSTLNPIHKKSKVAYFPLKQRL